MIRPGIRRLFHLSLWRRDAVRDDVDAEMQLHLELRARQLRDLGWNTEASEQEAARRFGEIDIARRTLHHAAQQREHRMQLREFLSSTAQDIRHAARSLRAHPAFTWTAIASLALGIGANVAIFSLINAVLVRSLPFPRPNELYRAWSANPELHFSRAWTSPVTFQDWRGQRHLIADMGGYFYMDGGTGVDLLGGGNPEHLPVAYVSPGFFSTLAVTPIAGRLPREDELSRSGDNHVVVLSWDLWARRFGRSMGVIDSVVSFGGGPYRVIGVMPRSFRFPNTSVALYIPYGSLTNDMVPWQRGVHTLNLVLRGQPTTAVAQVRAELNGIAKRQSALYTEETGWDAVTVLPMQQAMTGDVRTSLLVLGGAVAFVLVMACVNLASLLLARGASRDREVAIRIALGASRVRIARQLITESMLLSAGGGLASLVVAAAAIRLFAVTGVAYSPMHPDVQFDAASIGIAIALSIITGVLFGALPAIRSSFADPQDAMRRGGRGVSGPAKLHLRSGLVVGEVALAFVLAVGAGLMARTFLDLTHENLGFRADHLVTASFSIDVARHPDSAAGGGSPLLTDYEQILQRARAEPALVAVAAVPTAPLQAAAEDAVFLPPGMAPRPAALLPEASIFSISDAYFATMGAPMLQGREFLPSDRPGALPVVVVNAAFVRQYLGTRPPVDQLLLIGGTRPVHIVGVVGDLRQEAVATPARPTIYFPYAQATRAQVTLVARTTQPELGFQALRHAIRSVDPDQTITSMSTFDDLRDATLAQPRLITLLLALFGVVGLLLGATGVYGVLAYLVTERRREIGVRIALGAPRAAVLRLVMGRGLVLAVVGLALGTAGALATTHLLRGILYGVGPTDVATFAGVAVVLLAVSACAGWLPARCAARISPLDAIRE